MGVVTSKERTEQRPCPGCGTMTEFRILKVQRGEEVVLHMHKEHKAPCGRICYESSGMGMRQVITGEAHHPRRCDCVKEGRGYQ